MVAKGESVTKFRDSKLKWSGVNYGTFETRLDGTRMKSTGSGWGWRGTKTPNVKEEEAHYSSRLWDGENKYSYSRTNPSDPGYLIISYRDPESRTKDPGGIKGTLIGQISGYHYHDTEKLDELLLNRHTKLQVRKQMQPVRGNRCYVIDAMIKNKGSYTIWIDPKHDFHITRIEVKRKPGDYIGINLLEKGERSHEIFEILTYRKTANLWYPEKFRSRINKIRRGNPSTQEQTTTFTEVLWNPDHEKLGSFKPDDIPDGTSTRFRALPPSMEFFWQNGFFLDKDGRHVDIESIIKAQTQKAKNSKPKGK